MSNPRVRIERLAYGPHGVARSDGKVVFVRNVAPGDEVEIQIDEDHRSYAYASIQSVVARSPAFRDAPCEYLPACGGCPWQHIDYAVQLASKEEIVRDQLQRIGGLGDVSVRPILASPEELGYRSRLSLRTEARQLGFYAAASHDLIRVEHCLLGRDRLNGAMPAAAALVAELKCSVRRVQLVLPDSESKAVCLVGEVEGAFVPADEVVVRRHLQESPLLQSITLHGKGWRRIWGDPQIGISPEDGLVLLAQAGAFTQVNPLANRLLVQQVLELGQFESTDQVLDVYAGIGNLSFPIARRARHVLAIEQDRLATQAAIENVQRLATSNLEVLGRSALRGLSEWRRSHRRCDVIVVDPPRSGIAEIVDQLLEVAPPRLIYVSCNPSTLARDLKRLATRYRVEAVQPIDMFPHSYHVEVVVHAVLT